jgi:sulfate permease, SulP family
VWKRLKLFLTINDGRYEDLRKGNPVLNVMRDFMAGLVVAMVAIPLAMGFAMASGLRPEQGIVGGAVAGVVGALWGGSKYQVYGPTAAFIPVIAAIMLEYDHSFLVLIALLSGAVILLMALAGAGKIVKMVPHSIIVGFTIGIAFTIAASQLGELLGLESAIGYSFFEKIEGVSRHIDEFNVWALVLALGTFLFVKRVLKITVFIPAPLIALGIGAILANTLLGDQNLTLIGEKYGSIPAESWAWTPPGDYLKVEYAADIAYYTFAVVFVAAIESLLCSRMADRLANNKGTPYNPDKELFGQSLVLSIVPLLNGFPHTGALARTATNIKLGAISPLAGIFKFALKLLIAFYLARYLEMVPTACIAGILLYVATNMVKPGEVTEVLHMGRGHTALMIYTAAMVIVTDFLTGVLTALVIFIVWKIIEALGVPVAQAAVEHNTVRTHHPKVVRAVLHKDKAAARKPQHVVPISSERQKWIANLKARARLAPSAYIHDKASVIGDVVLGDHVNVAASASVRADEGTPFFIGSSSNIQDGVVIHALKDRYVQVGGEEWAVYVGKNVSMAHDALVHGPCYIGDGTFIGFKAVVHDSVVGERCFIGIGSVVVGVEIPDGKFVPHGMIVDSAAKVKDLPPSSEAHMHFNEDVVEVNRGLAAAYHHTHGSNGSNGHSNGHANGVSNGHNNQPKVTRPRVAREAGWDAPSFDHDRF